MRNQLAGRARGILGLATPPALGRLMLEDDPQFHRIEASRTTAFVEAALTDGASLARDAVHRFGDRPAKLPADLAAACGVEVVEAQRDGDFGIHVVYAQYRERPRRIDLFLPALAALERGATQLGLHPVLGGRAAREIFLAHELYHHLDLTRGGPAIAVTHRVTLLHVEPWRWTSGIASLAEIAAGAFAQALLDLPYHPKLLELVTLIDRAPQSAERSLERLHGAKEDVYVAAHSARPTT
ncbi:MAG TPA: hypothetical protein VFB54_19230 [Burkholderiales bacterium]|nr:hypothetical protein [Burkholderiales bacterium]